MNIISSHAYTGKNIYSHSPVIKLVIDLGEYYDTPSNKLAGFTDQLTKYLPNIHKHKCSRGYEGGFVERLIEGTYMGHIIEHVAIEIQNMLGYDISFGKTRQAHTETIYNIVYSYTNETAGLESGKLALELVKSIIENRSFDFEKSFSLLKTKCIKSDLGASTALIKQEAEKRNIPIIRLNNGSLLQLGYGSHQKRVQATLTENASCISVDIASNKLLTNSMLREYGIPVPSGRVVQSLEEAFDFCIIEGFPVVIKPNFGNQGKGVSVNLQSFEEVEEAYRIALEFNNSILIEKFIEGKNYRLLIVGDKLIAASERLCPSITGDGTHTVKELIDIENQNPLRGEGHEKPLTKIKLDKITDTYLFMQEFSLESIPDIDTIIKLRGNDNLSTGGIAIDVTDEVNEDIYSKAVQAAKIIGLDVAGIDITTKDITKPLKETGGAIIEVNAAPGIRMHHYPAKGKPRNAAKAIVDYLCPEDRDYRIPIISVTGTNGKTTTVRMLSHIISKKGFNVGMTTTSGIYISGKCINKGDNTGPLSAKTILCNNTVDYAVLETARGGIVKRGLGYDYSDVGIVTNITEDHLGIDEVNTLEDLADVKSLVIEAVNPTGYAVLNADNPYCAALSNKAKGKIIYFSKDINNKIVQRHINNGETAFFVKDGKLCLCEKSCITSIIDICSIPSTLNGIIEFNIYNSLAAAAGAYAAGITKEDIAIGLSSFLSNESDNPGRFNLYKINDINVILDYGHNIDAYISTIDTLKAMKKNKLIGVIGVPGDRTDTSTFKIGQLCGKAFDKIYIKEDKDLRGRKPGEIAHILKEGCHSTIPNNCEVIVELSEKKALEAAISSAGKNDIIIVFFEDYMPLVETIQRYKNNALEAQQKQALPAV